LALAHVNALFVWTEGSVLVLRRKQVLVLQIQLALLFLLDGKFAHVPSHLLSLLDARELVDNLPLDQLSKLDWVHRLPLKLLGLDCLRNFEFQEVNVIELVVVGCAENRQRLRLDPEVSGFDLGKRDGRLVGHAVVENIHLIIVA